VSSKKIQIEAAHVGYYSAYDEAAFFEWLDKIASVCDFKGRGSSLWITVDYDKTTEEDLLELLSLFRRYEVSMGQLIALDKPEFSEWFHERDAYWFPHIFGGHQTR
jgi:hypothetical protein